MVVAHQRLVEPIQHGGALLAPPCEIAREADALGRDIGARLFEPERKPAEFASERLRQLRVVGGARAVLVRALHEEGDGGRRIEHGEFELVQLGREIAAAAGDDHFSATQAREELADGGDGRRVVDVVDDHQPARMGLTPAERGGDFYRVLARVFFRQIENVRPGERRQTCFEPRRRFRGHEQQRRMLAFMLQRNSTASRVLPIPPRPCSARPTIAVLPPHPLLALCAAYQALARDP